MIDLYVYYQVRNENATRLEQRVRAMQAALAERHGVLGQLKRRPETENGLQTWMEIYPAAERGFEDALAAAEQDATLSELIEGKRHTDIFTDLITCV